MQHAIEENHTPNLIALHYEWDAWKVSNLILIPHFAFSLSVLERRKPLGSNARRAGWVGCNILLTNIPPDARISLVVSGQPVSPRQVRRKYARLRPLADLKVEGRGWTLDVLTVVRSLGRPKFALADVYAFEKKLAQLHPDNRHIRDKIRQQLQVLRDLRILRFIGDGKYCLG
jgi:type II restriction enzyme